MFTFKNKNLELKLAAPAALILIVLAIASLYYIKSDRSPRPTVLENQSNEQGRFVNEKENIDFSYPAEWGELTSSPRYISDNSVGLKVENEEVEFVAWHRETGKLVFVTNGPEYFEGVRKGVKLPQQTLSVLNSDGTRKKLYTMPRQEVESSGSIGGLMFSPQGGYLIAEFFFWEWSSVKVFSVKTGENILASLRTDPELNPFIADVAKDIAWASDEAVLVVKSSSNEFTGEGFDGLLISEYDSPQDLRKAFSASDIDAPVPLISPDGYNINDLRISDLRIDANGVAYFLAEVCPTYCGHDNPVVYSKHFRYDSKIGELEQQ